MYILFCDTMITSDTLLFFYSEGNSGYMNSDDGDMGYVVYKWGFSCLDSPLDVSISWIQSLSLYN